MHKFSTAAVSIIEQIGEMTRGSDDTVLSRWISFALVGGIVGSLVSIALSYIFFGIVLLLWMVHCWQSGKLQLKIPPFFVFIVAFVLATTISIASSSDVLTSLPSLKEHIKFLFVLMIFTYLGREQVEQVLRATFIVMGISAGYGILQYFWLWDVDLLNRIQGFMGHWMTFSGQLMLTSVALAGYLLLYRLPRESSGEKETTSQETASKDQAIPLTSRKFLQIGAWGVVWLIFVFVLILTHTRNSWLGAVGGLFLILWMYRKKWMMPGMVILVALFFLFPGDFKQRLYSSFDPDDTTTQVRIELLRTGRNIIAAHPWTGLGPRMVPRLYDEYNETDEFPGWIYQHLHNNFVQIAAEMGIITLIVWMSLWVRVFWDFASFARDPVSDRFSTCLAISGMGVLAAFLLAGLLEYNFGDSEILILLLFFITVPYVVHGGQEKAA
ncbi:O-antigen ligase family protein [Acidobacteria bacterium AH-259-D05]|nr:O-antigen ligase family protein [Acidobacteria bacterium AH-259-D05]